MDNHDIISTTLTTPCPFCGNRLQQFIKRISLHLWSLFSVVIHFSKGSTLFTSIMMYFSNYFLFFCLCFCQLIDPINAFGPLARNDNKRTQEKREAKAEPAPYGYYPPYYGYYYHPSPKPSTSPKSVSISHSLHSTLKTIITPTFMITGSTSSSSR